jgi:hypothetical protein
LVDAGVPIFRWYRRRVRFSTWTVFILWLLTAGAVLYRLAQTLRAETLGSDLRPVFLASRAAAHGLNPYTHPGDGLYYLPSAASILAPLTVVPFDTLVVFISISVLLADVVLVSLLSLKFGAPAWSIPLAVTLFIESLPVRDGLLISNVDAFMPLLIGAILLLQQTSKSTILGLLAGVTLGLKPLLLSLIIRLFGDGRKVALLVAGLTIAVLSIPVLLIPGTLHSFIYEVIPYLSKGEPGTESVSINIRSAFRFDTAIRLSLLATTVIVAIGLILSWTTSRGTGSEWLRQVLVLQAVISLLSSFSFPHHVASVMLLTCCVWQVRQVLLKWAAILSLCLLAYPRTIVSLTIYQQQAVGLLLVALCFVLVGWPVVASRWANLTNFRLSSGSNPNTVQLR